MPHPITLVPAGVAGRLLPALLAQTCPGCGQVRCGACDYCWAQVLGLDRGQAPAGVVALRTYEGLMRDLLTGVKYRNRPNTATWLAALFDEIRDDLDDVDVVTWAPTSRRRRQQRGFDQAEQLAHAVARRWHLPARGLLIRDEAPAQTGRGRRERLAGPGFRARGNLRWRHVLVLDDVVTTGATLRSAAEALHRSGVGRVSAVAVAATPAPALPSAPGRPVPLVPDR